MNLALKRKQPATHFVAFLLYFLRLGTFGFGGPQIDFAAGWSAIRNL